MATLRMSELPTSDAAQSNDFRVKQTQGKPPSAHDASSERNRVGTGARALRVLVVDAERNSANAFLSQVRYAGHDAHAAPDCRAALRVAAAWRPDVVLLDWDTPLLDPCQVAKHLRSRHLSHDCLIIAFANRTDEMLRKPCVEAGIDLLLSKPADPEVVETLLMLECIRVNRRRSREAESGQRASPIRLPRLAP